MPAYKGIRKHNERGLSVEDIFVVSSTYESLFDLDAASEVNVLNITETAEELKGGTVVSNTAKFSANENIPLTVADTDCIALLLSVVSGATVYVARFINPSDPVTQNDFCFVGVVDRKVNKKDLVWSSDIFASDTLPVSVYGFSATSFDAGKILGKKVEDLVRDSEGESTIDGAWKTANVADRLAYFKTDGSDGFGAREARFANLVSLENVLEYLFAEATESGVAVSFISNETNIWGNPALFKPYCYTGDYAPAAHWTGYFLRYCTDRAPHPQAPKPFVLTDRSINRLQTGGDATGSPFITLRLIDPNENEKNLSWLGYSLLELLGNLALCFGCVLVARYTATDAIEISFQTSEEFATGSFLIGDATDSETDISLTIAEESDSGESLHGVAYMLANEGAQYYHIESEPKQIFAKWLPPTDGKFLPLTISPTWAFLTERGEDAGFNLVDKVGRALLPHNVVFYDDGSPKSINLEYNLTAIHTAIYMRTTGITFSTELGVEGLTIYKPLAQIITKQNGVVRYYDTMLSFVGERQKIVQSYSEKTRKISVAGLLHFKDILAGEEDWRHARVGRTVVIDGEDFVCTKVVRKKTETQIELANKTEFVLDEFPDEVEVVDVPVYSHPITTPRDELRKGVYSRLPDPTANISRFDFLGLDDTGRVFKMHPDAENFGKQLGFSLNDFAWESESGQVAIQVQTRGELYLGEDALTEYPFPPNSRLFLRSGSPNFSNIPPDGSNDEKLFLEIGRLSPDGYSIIVDIKSNSAIFE